MTPVAAISTRALVDRLAHGDPDGSVTFGELLDQFSERAWGLFLLLALLPNFIPIPVGVGAISGALVVLIGVQLLLRLRRPWLPRFLARRGPRRSTLARLRDRLSPWLGRLERRVRPRMPAMLDHGLSRLVTGLLVLATGLLLTLPIPFTNYVLGLVALLFALAYLERDGALMGVAWATGLATIVIAAALSDRIARLAAHYF
jgi:hypothetical protein